VTRVANKDCRIYVERCVVFQASNLDGRWHGRLSKIYVVSSYGWYPLFVRATSGNWYEVDDGYSMITKKQIRQARPCYETTVVTTAVLKEIIDTGCRTYPH